MKETKSKNLILSQVRAARRVSVPILGITTPDPAATVEIASGPLAIKDDCPKLQWDIVEGLRSLNEAGKAERAKLVPENDNTVGNPVEALRLARKLADNSVLFVHMSNRWMVDATFVQAAWNLRDEFKRNHRTLILLGPSLDLPPELAGDVIVIDEPLPDQDQLSAIIRTTCNEVQLAIEDETLARSVEAVQGLPAFQAEQVVAMSLKTDGVDVADLWERKRRQIELTPGLKVNREPVKFSDIGGLKVIKEFLLKIINGEARPNAVCYLDEIEKALAGAAGGHDSSGVSQDQLGALLSFMQDSQAVGVILIGPPGGGKSMLAKAVGNEAGIPTIQMDLGSMKGSLVGASEQNMRAALKVITSVSNGRALFIATCNSISDIPPELRRRFSLGSFFIDTPDADERAVLWKIYRGKFSLKDKELPDDEGWTGAEIRQACDIAWRIGATLREAAKFVVPVSRSAAEQIERLRKGAEGRFLSASRPGVYSRGDESPESRTPAKRKLSLED